MATFTFSFPNCASLPLPLPQWQPRALALLAVSHCSDRKRRSTASGDVLHLRLYRGDGVHPTRKHDQVVPHHVILQVQCHQRAPHRPGCACNTLELQTFLVEQLNGRKSTGQTAQEQLVRQFRRR